MCSGGSVLVTLAHRPCGHQIYSRSEKRSASPFHLSQSRACLVNWNGTRKACLQARSPGTSPCSWEVWRSYFLKWGRTFTGLGSHLKSNSQPQHGGMQVRGPRRQTLGVSFCRCPPPPASVLCPKGLGAAGSEPMVLTPRFLTSFGQWKPSRWRQGRREVKPGVVPPIFVWAASLEILLSLLPLCASSCSISPCGSKFHPVTSLY